MSKSKKISVKAVITECYEGNTQRGHGFRYGLLVFDIVTISFLVISSFLNGYSFLYVDSVIGIILVLDFIARIWISRARLRNLFSFFGIIDLIVIASLIAPIVGEGFAFLRVIRSLRLLRSYQLLSRLRQDFKFFRRNERIVLAALNLGVFVFIMTSLVYETQHYTNPKIGNYADALYFTVTALTTTGFGDIVLEGTVGRMISVLIMIFGVSLFLRLVQVILRPEKVDFPCPDCGLLTHDRDAVHCKACGKLLNIPNEGEI